jgi:hypothetical protein
VCQAPYSTASGVSLKPDSPVTIRSLAIKHADFAPPFTLRLTAPYAAGPVDVDIPAGSLPDSAAAAVWFDLPGAGFAIPAATAGYTLELILPGAGVTPIQADKFVVVEWLSEQSAPLRPPRRQASSACSAREQWGTACLY